jgi:hypothetical protein
MLKLVKTNHALGFGTVVGFAIVVACGGNNSAIQYGVDGNVIDDAGPDTNGVHIISPDSGHHYSSGTGTSYGQPDTGQPDTWVAPVADTGPIGQPDTSPTSTCASTCTSDSECESTCPAAPAGSANCCDTATSACFQSASATCPGSTGHHDGGGHDTGADVY